MRELHAKRRMKRSPPEIVRRQFTNMIARRPEGLPSVGSGTGAVAHQDARLAVSGVSPFVPV